MTVATLGPVTIAGASLTDAFHTCALFDNDADEDAVILPFVREGLDQGERVIMIVDPDERDARAKHLRETGIDLDRLAAAHQFELLTWEDSYLRDGRFDQDAMLDLVRATFAQSRELGFPRTRVVGHMEWRLSDAPGVDAMIEYEARCNLVLADLQQPAICVYRIDRFNARTLIDVIRTHPIVVMGRTFRENPFFIPADEFLRGHAAAGA